MRLQLSTPSTWGAPKTLETAGGTSLDWVIYLKKTVNKGKINNIFKKFKSLTLLFKIIYAHFCLYSKTGDFNGLHSYSAYPVIRLLNAVPYIYKSVQREESHLPQRVLLSEESFEE